MYLRTPKRYQKQTRHVFSLRWLWLWILTPMVTLSGMYLYENRAELAPPIQQAIEDAARNLQGGVATMTAPSSARNRSRRLSRSRASMPA